MAQEIGYEAKIYARCEFKPFTRTKHKCLRCQQCDYSQYKWCLENRELRRKIDTILKTQTKGE